MGFDWNKLSGCVLGSRYVLDELVSAREQSAVFLTQLPDGDQIAIAETLAEDSHAGTQLRCWFLAHGLAHPNLVRIFDAGEESLKHGRFIYAVKDRPEEYLADVLDSRPLTAEEARQVVEALLLCLQYLHGNACVHGAVKPSNIVAVDGNVKLAVDTLASSTSSGLSAAQDMYALGATIVEVLTQKRLDLGFRKLDPKSNAIVTALPSPFGEIAAGCLQPDEAQRWTPDQGLAALSNRASRPNSVPSSRIAIFALLASLPFGCTVMLVWSERTRSPAKGAHYAVHDDRPSPIPQRGIAERTSISRTGSGNPLNPSRPSPSRESGSDWAVIVATYRDFDMAQRFANSLQARLKEFSCRVSPPRGQAEKYYYVILGSGLTKDTAKGLQERAIGAGFPASSYVTKIPKASLTH